MSWIRCYLYRLIQGHGQMATGTTSIQVEMILLNSVQLCLFLSLETLEWF